MELGLGWGELLPTHQMLKTYEISNMALEFLNVSPEIRGSRGEGLSVLTALT